MNVLDLCDDLFATIVSYMTDSSIYNFMRTCRNTSSYAFVLSESYMIVCSKSYMRLVNHIIIPHITDEIIAYLRHTSPKTLYIPHDTHNSSQLDLISSHIIKPDMLQDKYIHMGPNEIVIRNCKAIPSMFSKYKCNITNRHHIGNLYINNKSLVAIFNDYTTDDKVFAISSDIIMSLQYIPNISYMIESILDNACDAMQCMPYNIKQQVIGAHMTFPIMTSGKVYDFSSFSNMKTLRIDCSIQQQPYTCILNDRIKKVSLQACTIINIPKDIYSITVNHDYYHILCYINNKKVRFYINIMFFEGTNTHSELLVDMKNSVHILDIRIIDYDKTILDAITSNLCDRRYDDNGNEISHVLFYDRESSCIDTLQTMGYHKLCNALVS